VSSTTCISNSPSRLAAIIPLAVPDTLEMVTKSPSMAPCAVSVTFTVAEPVLVVKFVMLAPVTLMGVMSYHDPFW